MPRRLHRTSPSTVDPFRGVFSPKLVQGFRELLRTAAVAEINFVSNAPRGYSKRPREIIRYVAHRRAVPLGSWAWATKTFRPGTASQPPGFG